MAEATSRTFTTQDRWSVPLKYVSDILHTEEAFMEEQYTHTNTHTHTHTHTHIHIQTLWNYNTSYDNSYYSSVVTNTPTEGCHFSLKETKRKHVFVDSIKT